MSRIDPLSNALAAQTQRDMRYQQADPDRATHAAQAQQADGEFSLADGAEELSLHMAEKTEDKHHSERKVKGEDMPQIMDIDSIVEFLEKAHEADAQEKLLELTRQVMEGANPRQAAQNMFRDVAQQFCALQFVFRWLKNERQKRKAQPGDTKDGNGIDTLSEDVLEALQDMQWQFGPQIRAGLHSIDAAKAFATDGESVAAFQSTYRDVVLGQNSLAKTLDMALERFGGERAEHAITQLIKALGDDLAAARPSTDPTRLQALIQDLYQLEVALTVLEDCDTLATRIKRAAPMAMDSSTLMRDMVSLSTEKWITESRFSTMAGNYQIVELTDRLVFLAGVLGMLKSLPVQIYPDLDVRQSIINASQQAFDAAADEEY